MGARDDNGTTVERPPIGRSVASPEDATAAAEHVRRRAAGAVAHRVRTPLSLVISPILTALQSPDLDEGLRRQLQIALDQAEHVRTDLDELAEIACWPDGLDLRPHRLGELLADVGLTRLAGLTCQGLTYTIETTDTVTVLMDEARMRWTLDVLVRVGIGIGRAQGHIALRCHDDGDDVVASLTVLAEAHAEEAAASRPVMSVAEQIADLHGGTIEWTTGPSGAVVLRLPRLGADASGVRSSRRDDAAPTWPSVDVTSGRRMSVSGPDGAPLVLIVEDDPTLRSYLAESLSLDHRVVTAASAEDAIRIVERMRPDLIACDLLLPGASGEHFVQELHRDPDLISIPVIVVSGRNDDQRRVRMLQNGVDDFITKPFSFVELRARIINLLQRSGGLDDLRERAARAQQLADQLQRALDSRVVIEQAKAFIAAERQIGVEEAFEVLRRHARSNNLKLREVASAVVDDGFRP